MLFAAVDISMFLQILMCLNARKNP
jgi:hypothetical protein